MFLYQESDGFLFNSDAHFLYHFITQFRPKGTLLDIGTGCGILGLLCARDFPVDVTLIDKQHQNRLLAEQNARVNNLQADILCDDFLEHEFSEKFDTVISNPPYYHEGTDKSSTRSVTLSKSAEHLPFAPMVAKINRIIKPRGSFLFCYDAKQLPMLMHTLHEHKFTVCDIRFVHGTAAKPAQLVLIHARKGSRSLCTVHPPLIHFSGAKESDEVKSIYQKTRTYSIKCKIS
ncbi:MAG: methyltransferase [Sulfurospirillum sp.]|nr:MAG: methyltransferase [Sulfurospirillum sp.]